MANQLNVLTVYHYTFTNFLLKIIMQAEIEKVKKRREARALEKAQREEEMVSRFS